MKASTPTSHAQYLHTAPAPAVAIAAGAISQKGQGWKLEINTHKKVCLGVKRHLLCLLCLLLFFLLWLLWLLVVAVVVDLTRLDLVTGIIHHARGSFPREC